VKILVTGGTGYIGGTVAELLTEKGHTAVVFDNFSHSRRDLAPAGVELIEGELADRQGLEAIFETARSQGQPFDAVLHFAALIEAGESMLRPELFFRNNTASTLSLLEAMLACGPRRFVFSSTAAVYGEPESIPIQEDAHLAPANPYANPSFSSNRCWLGSTAFTAALRLTALLQCRRSARWPGRRNPRRSAHSRDSPDSADSRRCARTPPLSPHLGDDYPTPDGTCIRDYIHVSDLADAHLLALSALDAAPERKGPLIYNLGNGQGFSVRDVIESARRVTGHPIPAEVHPRRHATLPS